MSDTIARRSQVLVIGGGPGGSTTATLVARQGHEVILIEKTTGGRYHIGESLLPSCLRIFDLLGIREKVEKYGFIQKDGGYFDWGGERWEIAFATLSQPLHGFQVIRSEFDKLLLDHARSEGVEVLQGIEAREIVFDGNRPVAVEATDATGQRLRFEFDILVDASGRAGLMSTRYLHNRRFHEAFRNMAVWGYWKDAGRLKVGPAGSIATCSIPFGWVWAIPLHDGTLSVGVVLHTSKFEELRQYFPLEDIYHNSIASSPVVSELVQPGHLATALKSETDYSYAADHFSGPGYYLVGDAACFLDPLLSTGVHLATFSGLVAAASIASTLSGSIDALEAAQFYSASYRRAYLRMMVVVSALYQTHTGRDNYFQKAQRLTSTDYGHAELVQAFLHIITGIEDLKDVENIHPDELLEALMHLYDEHYTFVRRREEWNAMPLEKIQEGIARTRVVAAVQEEFSLTPETAINGLYVTTEQGLGLKRAESLVTQ
jgi:flavin-dependent dehydrogenase